MFQIGFAGIGEPPPKELVEKVITIIRILGKCCTNPIILVGGYWGIMKTIVDESVENNITVIIFPPIEREECPKDAICVRSGVSYKNRSILLVRSSDVLIVVGGASGTILELVIAYALGVPVFVLTNTGFPSDKIKECFGEYMDYRRTTRIRYYTRPENLAQDVCRICEKRDSL